MCIKRNYVRHIFVIVVFMIEIAILALLVIVIILLILTYFKSSDNKNIPTDEAINQIVKNNLQLSNGDIKSNVELQNTRMQAAIKEVLAENRDSQNKGISELSEKVLERLGDSSKEQNEALMQTRDKLQRQLTESITQMSDKNEKRLDDMRQTVDEKLQKTLNDRLTQSFDSVNKQLVDVNKGLGQMKDVAQSVGDLNKVLTGTKTRGIMGEVMLDQIISDMLPTDLYVKQTKIIKDSDVIADFAIKLPGDDQGETIYLPIDSKFPLDDYRRLEEAYDAGDKTAIETYRKELLKRVEGFAKDIYKKYVKPPETTNFGIMFVPTEGLFAELARQTGFMDQQRKNGIIIAGPSTISALLNSLQVGFRTLQIQKGAADIEKTLGAVKKEFDNFAGVLQKAQKNITDAGKSIDTLVGTRTNKINKALENIEIYDGPESSNLIGTDDLPEIEDK